MNAFRQGAATIASLAIVAVALAALPEAATAATAETRSISVTGEGEAFGRPDEAQVTAGVQTRADTVAAATRENQARIEAIMAALGEHGIAEKDIQTANYSIWPEYDNDGPRRAEQSGITGFHVSNMVNVTVKDIDTVGAVLAAVTEAGANSINGVHFRVSDTAALEERARQAAMADGRERAAALAELAGVTLGEVLTISTSSGGWQPMPAMARRMEMADGALAAPGISPGEQSVSVQIHATFAIR